jgi:hypothetical protein
MQQTNVKANINSIRERLNKYLFAIQRPDDVAAIALNFMAIDLLGLMDSYDQAADLQIREIEERERLLHVTDSIVDMVSNLINLTATTPDRGLMAIRDQLKQMGISLTLSESDGKRQITINY